LQIDDRDDVDLSVAPRLPLLAYAQLNGCMTVAYTGTVNTPRQGEGAHPTATDDWLLATLAPVWQIVIGVCVLVVVIGASGRLVRRGRSRMTTALVVTGTAAVAIAVIGVLMSGR
jgi:hypothetical protein